MDTINNKIKVRYGSLYREIYEDISYLDQKNFKDIKNEALTENTMKKKNKTQRKKPNKNSNCINLPTYY